MATRKDELTKAIRAAQCELSRIESVERDAENAALIGKCFRYENSYGSSRPSWLLYVKIVGTRSGNLVTFDFQTDCDGKIEIRPGRALYGHRVSIGNGYKPISAAAFQLAWRAVQKRVAKWQP